MEKIDLTKWFNCRFRAKDDGKEVEGRIAVDGDYLRFFYDNGDMYSIHIPCYQEHGINYFDDFRIVPRDPETYKDWQVGDKVCEKDNKDSVYRVIFRSGELVVTASAEDGALVYTCNELYNDGCRLVLTDIEKQIIKDRKEAEREPQDGDIVAWKDKDDDGDPAVSIYKGRDRGYATIFANGLTEYSIYARFAMNIIRPATDEEKKRLFDAMAKQGKRWNAEKKVVEDIPKPHEFKKGEPVLVRDYENSRWLLAAYSGEDSVSFLADTGKSVVHWKYCIPYNESTMHLLGTTEDYKEGE